MKEVIAKLERILELTSTHGITLQPEGNPATSDDQLMFVESKIRLNAIKALDIFNKNNIEKQKPRTKTEFVKCEFNHAWEALKAFEDGEDLFRDKNQTLNTDAVEFVKAASVGGIGYILTYYRADNLYRKVETEIDERQEFIDKLPMPDLEAWFWELDSVDKKDEYRINTKLKLSRLISAHYGNLFESSKLKVDVSE